MIKEFVTEYGDIIPSVTTNQMMEIDRIVIEETGPNLFQMMENAGRNLAELSMKVINNERENKSIIVLSGTGGNGGGGICVARHLANRGYDITVCVDGTKPLKEVTNYQLHVLKSTVAKIISVEELKNNTYDLLIDSVIGYSLRGEPSGEALLLIEWAMKQKSVKISLDIPSGIDATTGESTAISLKPDYTLTLALPKRGLLPEHTGELFLGDIGIPNKVYEKIGLNIGNVFADKFIVKIIPYQ